MSDPIQIAQCLPGRAEVDRLWRCERARDPENTRRQGACDHCGAPIPGDGIFGNERIAIPDPYCGPCVSKLIAEKQSNEAKQRLQAFAEEIPPEFLAWDEGLGNNAALARARTIFASNPRAWLVLYGPSGTCKTRIGWELLKDARVNGLSALHVDAASMEDEGIPPAAAKVGLFLFDDIGHEAMKERTAARFLSVLNRRYNWHLPLIITTQLKSIAGLFSNAPTAQATMRRIYDRCKVISTAPASPVATQPTSR